MGCIHYEEPAAKAEAQIKELEAERAQYVAAKTAVEEAERAISCYTSFLSSLSEAMSNVVVSGQPFDKGDTKVHYDNLSKGAKTLEALTTEMDTALSEIALEIASLEPIVAARDGICAACYYSYY